MKLSSDTAAHVCVLALTFVASDLVAQRTTKPSALGAAAAIDIAAGKRIFEAQCAWCHGAEGTGGMGPSLQRATLRHAANDNGLIDIVRNGIPNTEMPSFAISLTERSAWQTAAYVRSLGRTTSQPPPGDAKRGATLYESTGCGGCHVINGRGDMLGPELTSIGALRGAAHLRESIVKPAAAHPTGYLVVRARTSAGREIRGIQITEDVFWIHIRDAGGAVHVLQKSELSSLDRELEGTLMPSYESRLSSAQLDDLVAFLASLRGPS